nr:hypothetical protein [Tanacetum cinerariifolium]
DSENSSGAAFQKKVGWILRKGTYAEV